MFQPWRLRLREAEEALKSGRLDEASRLLCQGDLQQFYPAKKLLAKAAAQMVARGQTHARNAETSAGWRDLQSAEGLGAAAEEVGTLRRQLVDMALAEAEKFLAAGNLEACQAVLETLEQRGGGQREARQLRQVVRKVDLSRRLSQRGKFAQAEEALSAALVLRPDLKSLHEARHVCQQRLAESQQLSEQLHRALSSEDWSQVQTLAEQLLGMAPQCPVALDGRRRAWAAVGMQLVDSTVRPRFAAAAGRGSPSPPRAVATMENPIGGSSSVCGPRFILWIDGVGGFLICEGEQVVLGQPSPGGQVDVPILGDVSRQHARIERNGEGYLIFPLRPTRVQGRHISAVTSLADGSLIELGEGVQLRFRRPHALSGTGRLDFISHHRTQPSADAVVLMADSCILGPSANSHIVCRDWTRQVVLFRQDGQLWCRTSGVLHIDGQRHDGEGPITRGSQVTGDDFSLSLEEV